MKVAGVKTNTVRPRYRDASVVVVFHVGLGHSVDTSSLPIPPVVPSIDAASNAFALRATRTPSPPCKNLPPLYLRVVQNIRSECSNYRAGPLLPKYGHRTVYTAELHKNHYVVIRKGPRSPDRGAWEKTSIAKRMKEQKLRRIHQMPSS